MGSSRKLGQHLVSVSGPELKIVSLCYHKKHAPRDYQEADFTSYIFVPQQFTLSVWGGDLPGGLTVGKIKQERDVWDKEARKDSNVERPESLARFRKKTGAGYELIGRSVSDGRSARREAGRMALSDSQLTGGSKQNCHHKNTSGLRWQQKSVCKGVRKWKRKQK